MLRDHTHAPRTDVHTDHTEVRDSSLPDPICTEKLRRIRSPCRNMLEAVRAQLVVMCKTIQRVHPDAAATITFSTAEYQAAKAYLPSL